MLSKLFDTLCIFSSTSFLIGRDDGRIPASSLDEIWKKNWIFPQLSSIQSVHEISPNPRETKLTLNQQLIIYNIIRLILLIMCNWPSRSWTLCNLFRTSCFCATLFSSSCQSQATIPCFHFYGTPNHHANSRKYNGYVQGVWATT